jgi:hypothetical protein
MVVKAKIDAVVEIAQALDLTVCDIEFSPLRESLRRALVRRIVHPSL